MRRHNQIKLCRARPHAVLIVDSAWFRNAKKQVQDRYNFSVPAMLFIYFGLPTVLQNQQDVFL